MSKTRTCEGCVTTRDYQPGVGYMTDHRCQACQGSGMVEERIPAQDSWTDMVQFWLAIPTSPGSARVAKHAEMAAFHGDCSRGGINYALQPGGKAWRINGPVKDATKAAHWAFRAVPALRS